MLAVAWVVGIEQTNQPMWGLCLWTLRKIIDHLTWSLTFPIPRDDSGTLVSSLDRVMVKYPLGLAWLWDHNHLRKWAWPLWRACSHSCCRPSPWTVPTVSAPSASASGWSGRSNAPFVGRTSSPKPPPWFWTIALVRWWTTWVQRWRNDELT